MADSSVSTQQAVGGWLVTLLALLALLALSACDRKPADPPLPKSTLNTPVAVAVALAVVSSSGTPDPSVPSAAATVAAKAEPAASTARDEPANRPPDVLTKAQESNAMPMPGQVNNHSTTANDGGKRSASTP